MRYALLLLFAGMLWNAAPSKAAADDWPMYRRDAMRSGFTAEPLPNRLDQRWVFRLPGAPRPAWPTSQRMEFDLAFQPILVGDVVLFGSSADGKVYALEAETGDVRWTFFTEAPIRFAPAGWQDRVFVASDDGWLYALAIEDGKLLWKHRGGPSDERVLGNERIVSRWPARGGPVVLEDSVYYAAGVWPSDGIYLYALDAETGTVQWNNDRTGGLYMPQPHGGAEARSGVSPQGYLLASDDQLLVPTGRAVPAAFRRSDGELLYYHLQKNQHRGGSEAMFLGDYFLNAGCLFAAESGELVAQQGHGPLAAAQDGLVRGSGRSLIYYRWTDAERRDRRGERVTYRTLEEHRLAPLDAEATALIVADQDAVCGASGRVSLIDFTRQRNIWWSHEVEGTVYGLAAANGRLVASTDEGLIYCFDDQGGGGASPPPGGSNQEAAGDSIPAEPDAAAPESGDQEGEADVDYTKAVEEIIEKTGITEGYCVDLGAGTGRLALELARRTDLQIYAVEADADNVALARRRLEEAGVYGTRVTVHQADPAGAESYPRYFANLIVSSRSLHEPLDEQWRESKRRMQRPYGGQICIGPVGRMQVDTRGPLAGAGSWTHQNSNAANTVCSMDSRVKGPLRMHWFRDVEFEIPNRHGQGPAPLVHRGHLVVGGVHGLCALDAYNGRVQWMLRIPGLLGDYDGIHHDVGVGDTGSSFCLSDDSVFVKVENRCVKIDLTTGEQVAEFETPVDETAQHRHWGYLAYRDGRIFGTVANDEHTVSPRYKNIGLRTESVLFFVMDAETGELLWQYRPQDSIRNNAIAIGRGRVFLVDRPLAPQDRISDPRRGGRHRETLKPEEHAGGTLVALDTKSGEEQWRQADDVFGTQLALSEEHDVLLMYYQAVRHRFFKLPSEIGGRIAAFDADSGRRLWDRDDDYETRPLINGDKVYAQGGGWDLQSGTPLPFELDRSYGCGQISASAHLMLFRSATLGYLDLSRDAGTENYGGIRPSCWINAIPAGGLVLVPDGSAKCQCSYQMRAWLALDTAE